MTLHVIQKNKSYYEKQYQERVKNEFERMSINVEYLLSLDGSAYNAQLKQDVREQILLATIPELISIPIREFLCMRLWAALLNPRRRIWERKRFLEQGIISDHRGYEFILPNYMLNPNFIWTRYALRSLSFYRYSNEEIIYVTQKIDER